MSVSLGDLLADASWDPSDGLLDRFLPVPPPAGAAVTLVEYYSIRTRVYAVRSASFATPW
jgi:hypothetical protein